MSTPDWDPKWGPPPPAAEPKTSAADEKRGTGAGPPTSLMVLLAAQLCSALWTTASFIEGFGACAGVGLLLELVLLYFLFAGHRWAWVLAQIFSVFALFGFAVFLLPAEITEQLGRGRLLKPILDAILGAVSLWVLNTSAVREYVIGTKARR